MLTDFVVTGLLLVALPLEEFAVVAVLIRIVHTAQHFAFMFVALQSKKGFDLSCSSNLAIRGDGVEFVCCASCFFFAETSCSLPCANCHLYLLHCLRRVLMEGSRLSAKCSWFNVIL